VKRYDLFWASLDPTSGAGLAKTRPVVIVSLDDLNAVLDTVVVCPLTTSLRPSWRSRLQVGAGHHRAEIAVDQIRTISKSRLRRKLGRISEKEAGTLRRIITEMYGE
jgi:mRNA interferase MazF